MSSPVAQATWRDCSTGQLSPVGNGEGEEGGRRGKGGRGREKKEGGKKEGEKGGMGRREAKERGNKRIDNEPR